MDESISIIEIYEPCLSIMGIYLFPRCFIFVTNDFLNLSAIKLLFVHNSHSEIWLNSHYELQEKEDDKNEMSVGKLFRRSPRKKGVH